MDVFFEASVVAGQVADAPSSLKVDRSLVVVMSI